MVKGFIRELRRFIGLIRFQRSGLIGLRGYR